jgi:hypothetical protein
MHLYDRLRNAVATATKSLLKRRDDAVAYAKTLPTRAKIRAASTTSRLGDSLVDLAAKLHEATTETKRQQWRRRIREWRQQVRIEELVLKLRVANEHCPRVDLNADMPVEDHLSSVGIRMDRKPKGGFVADVDSLRLTSTRELYLGTGKKSN